MSIVASIRKQITPIHPEGFLFVAGAVVLALVADWLLPRVGWVFWLLPIFVAYFFRDPKRMTPLREGLVVSPADGRVSFVGQAVPPPELGLGDQPMLMISIFLSVFDVHINRAPVSGRIRKIVYTPGSSSTPISTRLRKITSATAS